MKNFLRLLIVLSICLLGYNVTKLDFENIFEGDSMVALIGIAACACAVLLLIILSTSLKIAAKSKRR